MKHPSLLLSWVWGEGGGGFAIFRFPFTVASWLYGFASGLRVRLYQKGLLPKKRVNCHLISIGNITAGGTGKTPMTIFLAEQWREKGHSVGIVSRGYKGKNNSPVLLVSDGFKPLASSDVAGDEPILMAERLHGVPIVVAADRFKGCRYLISRFQVDIILMDDGFQHLRLHRNMNLVMIDTTNPFGNGHLLPRGSLREPVSALKRADLVILTRTDEGLADRLAIDNILKRIEPFQRNILQSRFEATHLIDLSSGEETKPSDLAGERILPFCGIGNPAAFLKQLTGLGAKIETSILFEDHHHYNNRDFIKIGDAAKKQGVARIVTTEKDAVKIKHLMPNHLKIFALRIGTVFKKGSEDLVSQLFVPDSFVPDSFVQ